MRNAVDMRSDTVTLPGPAMREAMHRAAVGDDVFGEDPTINELEALAARLTGMEAALYVPSGCMANLIAQLIHVRRGDVVLTPQDSHIVLHEVGSGAAIANAQYEVIPRWDVTADDVAERIRIGDFHEPGTGLVWVENTHNVAGGRVLPLESLRRIAEVVHRNRLPLHLDGARVFNAAVALGVPVKAITELVDSVSFCLSKGLGAPVGSMLCGTAAFREHAVRFRKMLGGGMRQAGVLAAAGIYGLTHNVERLAQDHARAKRLAQGIAGLPGLEIHPEDVETNIVIAWVDDGADFVRRCEAEGLRILTLDRRKVRFVVHLDVNDDDIERAIATVTKVLKS